MPVGDPSVFVQEPAPGRMRHTFTGIRASFPNVSLHAIVNRWLPYRRHLFMRPEFNSGVLWSEPLVTFFQGTLSGLMQEIQEYTDHNQYVQGEALQPRLDAQRDFMDRIVDKDTALDQLSNEIEGSHADEILMPARPSATTLSFDYTGVDENHPQPTPGRIPNDNARAVIVGMDFWVTNITLLPSADLPQMINKKDSANLIIQLSVLYKLIDTRAAADKFPTIPSGLERGQLDQAWNANGTFDPLVTDGTGQMGAPKNMPELQGLKAVQPKQPK